MEDCFESEELQMFQAVDERQQKTLLLTQGAGFFTQRQLADMLIKKDVMDIFELPVPLQLSGDERAAMPLTFRAVYPNLLSPNCKLLVAYEQARAGQVRHFAVKVESMSILLDPPSSMCQGLHDQNFNQYIFPKDFMKKLTKFCGKVLTPGAHIHDIYGKLQFGSGTCCQRGSLLPCKNPRSQGLVWIEPSQKKRECLRWIQLHFTTKTL